MNQKLSCWASIAEIPSGIVGLVTLTLAASFVLPAARAQVELPDYRWDYDGHRILGPIGQAVYVWDAETGREIWRLAGHGDYIFKVLLSPDGRYAMTSSWIGIDQFIPQHKDISTRLWDLETGEEIHRLENQVAGDFSPDSRRIVTFELQTPARSNRSDVVLWDVASGDRLLTIDESMSPGFFAFAPDGISAYVPGQLRFARNGDAILYHWYRIAAIWDAETGREIGALNSDRFSGTVALRFDSSAQLLAAIGSHGRVEIWDLAAGELTRLIAVEPASRWKWTHDGSRAVGADGQNHRVLIWDAEAEEMTIGADCVCFFSPRIEVSPDATRFAVQWGGGSSGGERFGAEMGLYDARTGEEIAVIWLRKNETSVVATKTLIGFAPDGETFLVAGDLFTVYSSQTGEALVSYDLFAGHKP